MHRSDQEDVQMIKDWWKKYGTAILIGLCLFVGANFGWQYWTKFKERDMERASITYLQLLQAERDNKYKEFELFSEHLLKNYKHSPYASLAALRLAQNAVNAHNLTLALKNLNWIVDNSSFRTFRQIARLRGARILFETNKNTEALEILKKVDDEGFLAAIEEVKGDILSKMGQTAEAKKAYQNALNATKGKARSPLLKMKLEQ